MTRGKKSNAPGGPKSLMEAWEQKQRLKELKRASLNG
jgi:hypothetical protein